MKREVSFFTVLVFAAAISQAQLIPASASTRRRVVAPSAAGTVLNVRAFGARGDGQTDDTAAIQRAINSMPPSVAEVANPGASPSATIFIPAGTYVITRTLVIPDGAAAYIAGEGMFASILDWRGAGDTKVIDVHATHYTIGFSLEDLGISNSVHAPHTTAVALGAGGVMLEALVSRVLIDSHGIGVLLTGECDEATIFGSWFSGDGNGIVGVSTTGTNSNLLAEQNQFQGCTGWAVKLDGGSQHTFLRNTIQGITPNMKGISLDKFDSAVVIGNYFESGSGSGTAGPFLSLGETEIGGAQMSGAIVSGNHVDFARATEGQVGIRINFARGVTIQSNAFTALDTAIQVMENAESVEIGVQSWGNNVAHALDNRGQNVVVLDKRAGSR